MWTLDKDRKRSALVTRVTVHSTRGSWPSIVNLIDSKSTDRRLCKVSSSSSLRGHEHCEASVRVMTFTERKEEKEQAGAKFVL